MVAVHLRFDLRVPDFVEAPREEYYATALEMARWADEVGIDGITISEHHGSQDGFLPSPMLLASAMAAVTDRIGLSVSALLVPLHDPVKMAEDLAVLDHVSAGRLSVIAGLGYRREEYALFGRSWQDRGRLMDDNLEVMLDAWAGRPVERDGHQVHVTPRPLQQPGPVLMVGGSSRPAARRAARLRLGFFPAVDDPELRAYYKAQCEEHGWSGFVFAPRGPGFVHVTDDPDDAWERLAPHLLHDARGYAAWQAGEEHSHVHEAAESVQGLRDGEVYEVLTPDGCVALAERLGRSGALVLNPLCGGIPPELAWDGLERFAEEVLPRLRATRTA